MAWVEGPAQQQEGSGTRPTQHRPGLQRPGLLLLVSPWPLPGAHPAPSAPGPAPSPSYLYYLISVPGAHETCSRVDAWTEE